MTRGGRLQSLGILLAVVLGLILGQSDQVAARAGSLIVPFLMLMLVGVFLQVPLRGFTQAFRDLRFTGLSLGINFVWTPVFGFVLGAVFLRDQPDLWIGLIMLLVTPCTDWYLVFTNLARGNVARALTLLPWHLVLQLLLLPVYLLVFDGTLVSVEFVVLVRSILLVLLLPMLSSALLRVLLVRRRGGDWLNRVVLPTVGPGQLLFLCLAIAAMSASQGGVLLDRFELLPRLRPPLLLFFAANLAIALGIGRSARLDWPSCTGLSFAALSRNSPVSLAIALAAFPDRPLIATTLVIGSLIELPVMALVARILVRVPAEPAYPGSEAKEKATPRSSPQDSATRPSGS